MHSPEDGDSLPTTTNGELFGNSKWNIPEALVLPVANENIVYNFGVLISGPNLEVEPDQISSLTISRCGAAEMKIDAHNHCPGQVLAPVVLDKALQGPAYCRAANYRIVIAEYHLCSQTWMPPHFRCQNLCIFIHQRRRNVRYRICSGRRHRLQHQIAMYKLDKYPVTPSYHTAE